MVEPDGLRVHLHQGPSITDSDVEHPVRARPLMHFFFLPRLHVKCLCRVRVLPMEVGHLMGLFLDDDLGANQTDARRTS